jgi:hypothetical protein
VTAINASTVPPSDRSRTNPATIPAVSAGSATTIVLPASVSSVNSEGARPRSAAGRRLFRRRSCHRYRAERAAARVNAANANERSPTWTTRKAVE